MHLLPFCEELHAVFHLAVLVLLFFHHDSDKVQATNGAVLAVLLGIGKLD